MVAAMTLDGRKTKLVLVVLGLSLLANIFAVSFAFGRFSAESRQIGADARLAYPPAVRAELRTALQERRDDLAAAVRRLRDARAALFDVARAAQLDDVALKAAMADVRAATTAIQEVSQDALAEALRKSPAEERAGIRRPLSLRDRD